MLGRALIVALTLAVTTVLATHSAHGQESAPLWLVVEPRASKLDAEAIRRAVEVELGRAVELTSDGAASLRVTARGNQTVTVSYRAANGVTRSRTIGVPQDAARRAEVIALLAGNLSRDEAAELLAGLAAKASPPAASEPPPDAEPKPEEPAPAPEPTPEPKATKREPTPPPAAAASGSPPGPKHAPLNFSLISPLALYPNAKERRINAELGLFYSYVGELEGAGVNALVLRTKGRLRGVGVSGVLQWNGGLEGAQLSGLLNVTRGPARGLSAAGAVNLERDLVGAEIAGAFNHARDIEGLQAAGAVNVARRVTGLQLGVVNVAEEVNGVQLGVVNVAKRVKGTSIGVVSVAGNGRVQPVLYVGTKSLLSAAVKFTIGPLYTQAGFGDGPGSRTWQYELGVGGHIPIGRWFVEPGVHYSEVRSLDDTFGAQVIEYTHYRVAAGLDLGQVSPFVGGGLLQRFHHAANAPASVPVTVEGFAGVALF